MVHEREPVFHRTKYGLEGFCELVVSHKLARSERDKLAWQGMESELSWSQEVRGTGLIHGMKRTVPLTRAATSLRVVISERTPQPQDSSS